MRKVLAGILMLFSTTLVAGDEQRYQMLLVQQSGLMEKGNIQMPKVLILDTAEGHLWTWGVDIARKQQLPVKVHNLTYQGKLVPGKEMGEIISSAEQ